MSNGTGNELLIHNWKNLPGLPNDFWHRSRFLNGLRDNAELSSGCSKNIDVRILNLRHTFASLQVSGGASLEMIGRLRGHT